jgi:hypothetical protein
MMGMMFMSCLIIAQTVVYLTAIPLIKWLMIGRLQPGRHWVWSWFYLRWLCVCCATRSRSTSLPTPTSTCSSTGCSAPASVPSAASARSFTTPLVTLGDDVYIAANATLATSEVIDHQIVFSHITIGSGAAIQSGACIMGGATVPPECFVDPQSLVRVDDVLEPGVQWSGCPGQHTGPAPAVDPRLLNVSTAGSAGAAAAAAAAAPAPRAQTPLLSRPQRWPGLVVAALALSTAVVAGLDKGHYGPLESGTVHPCRNTQRAPWP